MNNTKDYIIQYGATALDINTTQLMTLLNLIHCRDLNGYNNVCNPTRERLGLGNGLKNPDKVSAVTKVLEEKGYIVKIPFSDANSKKSRVQYNINDELIIALCKNVEQEWYAKWKEQDTEVEQQAEIVANPEHFTPEEVREATQPAPKEAPAGKQYNPLTGKLVNVSKPINNATVEAVDITSFFNPTQEVDDWDLMFG